MKKEECIEINLDCGNLEDTERVNNHISKIMDNEYSDVEFYTEIDEDEDNYYSLTIYINENTITLEDFNELNMKLLEI